MVIKGENIEYDKDSRDKFAVTGISTVHLENFGDLNEKDITEKDGVVIIKMDNRTSVTFDCIR